MQKIPIYVVDAFAEELFGGNPAAVCPLQYWLPDATLQAIAAENNLSETAFFVPDEQNHADFRLRWFTPTVEVPLCGHATLGSGHVVLEELGFARPRVNFITQSGVLSVERAGELLRMELPAAPPQPLPAPPKALREGLGAPPQAWLATPAKYFAVYPNAAAVAALTPDMASLTQLTGMGVVATAPGDGYGVDFVSRYFTPACGIPEDPVTGSAHCLLVPYWAQRLGKTRLEALQISARRGRLQTELAGDRVRLAGRVVPYLRGEIAVPERAGSR
ncbi:MAG: PhzF family phenazine biosynthesis protein [Nevskia sp.]|nr:PhzF family phenazine biosynthesis protein [Nevskia sp.]